MTFLPPFLRKRIEHRPALLKIVDNMGWLVLDNLLKIATGLLVGVWVARYLGPDQFGVFSFASALAGMFGAIVGLGLQGIVVRDIVRDPSLRDVTLGTVAALKLSAGFVSYAFLVLLVCIIRPDEPLVRTIVAIVGLTLLFKVSDIAAYWFESQVEAKYVVWTQNSIFLIISAVKVALILNNASIFAFAWATVVETAVTSIALLWTLSLRGGRLSKLRAAWWRAVELLKTSWPLLMSSIAITIYMRIDQIMLGEMVGDAEVGIFSAASRISEIWYFIPVAIVASVTPAILRAKQISAVEYQEKFQGLFSLLIWLSLAVAVPMSFLATSLVTILYGDSYVAAGSVLVVHIWSSIFVFIGIASGQWLLAENLEMLSFQRTLFGAITNVALNLWLIPIYGALGAAIATVGGQLFANVLFDVLHVKTRRLFCMKLNSLDPRVAIKLIN